MSGPPLIPSIALPVGDPNGIGPEIALRSAVDPAVLAVCHPVLIADQSVLDQTAARLGLSARVGKATGDGVLSVATVEALKSPMQPGEVTAAAGAAAVAYAQAAIRMAEDGEAAAVVAAPHNETAVAKAGIAFAGYPGLLAETTGTDPDHVFLMLVTPRFRIVHVTLHIGLRQALDRLTTERVLHTLRATDTALQMLGIDAPHIGVFGINPHAGEGGLFGNDDGRITVPAVAAARAEGLRIDGPAGADVMLPTGDCDAYLAMYHDQGHIPAKLEGRGAAVGLSIGAPVLFSSVAHGSAHDIAGTGAADAAPLTNVLKRVAAMVGRSPRPDVRQPDGSP